VRKSLVERGQLRGRPLDIERAECFGQAVAAPRADQRHDVLALRGADALRDRAQLVRQWSFAEASSNSRRRRVVTAPPTMTRNDRVAESGQAVM
jgi:hypothetical protein